MAFTSSEVSFRSIWSRTFGVLRANHLMVLLYLAVFAGGGTAVEILTDDARTGSPYGSLAAQVFLMLASVVGGYLLMAYMLQRAGSASEASVSGFFAYLSMTIVSSAGVLAGLAILLVPGLVLFMRWFIAAPVLIARGEGPIQALKSSWELTRGYAITIFVAGIPASLLLFGFVVLAGRAVDGQTVALTLLMNATGEVFSVLSIAMAVAVFGSLDRSFGELGEIFA